MWLRLCLCRSVRLQWQLGLWKPLHGTSAELSSYTRNTCLCCCRLYCRCGNEWCGVVLRKRDHLRHLLERAAAVYHRRGELVQARESHALSHSLWLCWGAGSCDSLCLWQSLYWRILELPERSHGLRLVPRLDRGNTRVICLECLGCRHLRVRRLSGRLLRRRGLQSRWDWCRL